MVTHSKTLFFLVAGLLVGSPPADAQRNKPAFSGEVVYAYYPDSVAIFQQRDALQAEDPEGNARTIGHLQDQYYVTRSLVFQLTFDRDESLFELSPQLRLDTENRLLHNLAILETDGDQRYYLNTAERTRLYERPALDSDTLYHLTDTYDKHPWTLTPATKTVAGYPCRQATYDYTYTDLDGIDKTVYVTAWYAPDLPYPYGPAGYDGLPGLILELTTRWKRSQTYRATSVAVTRSANGSLPAILNVPDRITSEAELAREAYERIESRGSNR